MHETESDLSGRYLSGKEGGEGMVAPYNSGGRKAFVFFVRQPFPGLIRRHGPAGGTTEAERSLRRQQAKAKDNIVGTIDCAGEFALRLGYRFQPD